MEPSYEDLMQLYNELVALDVSNQYVFTSANGKKIVLKRIS